ncbi:MAG: trypsin-like peptidase domain-containing protein [Gemmatimonadota bacterium]
MRRSFTPPLAALAAGVLLAWPAGAGPIDASRRTAVVQAVERVQPAVVSVHVIHRQPVVYRYRDPFREFFFPGSPYLYYREEQDRTSGGSGLVVSKDGHVLTNAHVVGDERTRVRIEVSLPDGRSFEARSAIPDQYTDLAVLQVDAPDLPVAPLGTSADILVGEWAIAIGNPFDLGPTVSIGVVSAVDRDFQEPQGDYYYRDMIQTDAAINPGNSGGPLVNAAGEVIGINSFIYTGSEYSFGSIGIGFAIPIDAARRFLDEVQTHGRVRQAWTGIVALRDLTDRLAHYLQLDSRDGALVVQVAVDSPAFAADLRRGDVIVSINGEAVRGAEEVRGILRQLSVGARCALVIARAGKRQELSFELGEQPRWY